MTSGDGARRYKGATFFRAELGTIHVLRKHCTEVLFASFLLGGFITAIVVNLSEKKLAKRTYVHCIICSTQPEYQSYPI